MNDVEFPDPGTGNWDWDWKLDCEFKLVRTVCNFGIHKKYLGDCGKSCFGALIPKSLWVG